MEEIIRTEEQPENLLDQLAERRREIADTRETLLPLPGYDTDSLRLLVKYRLLDGEEFTRIGEAVRKSTKNSRSRWERQLLAAVDTLVAACMGLFVDINDGSGPKPLTIGGNPVLGFTPELASALGFADKIDDPNRPRDVVFGLFGNNDVMISQHSMQLNRWMSDTSVDVSEEMFGPNL